MKKIINFQLYLVLIHYISNGFTIIIIGFLIGFIIGTYYGSRQIVFILFVLGILFSYHLHNKGYIRDVTFQCIIYINKNVFFKSMVNIKNFTPRLYQETIMASCAKGNCLIILPTGLGKTKTAIQLLRKGLILFLNQRYFF